MIMIQNTIIILFTIPEGEKRNQKLLEIAEKMKQS